MWIWWNCATELQNHRTTGKYVSFHKINNIYIGFPNKFLLIRKHALRTPHLSLLISFLFSSPSSSPSPFSRSLVQWQIFAVSLTMCVCVFSIHISLWLHEKEKNYPKNYSYRAHELMAKDANTFLCDVADMHRVPESISSLVYTVDTVERVRR